VRERLQQPDVQPGFLLDGFPRNLGQAQALDEILTECCTGPLIVVDIEVPEQELVRRLRHRLICKNCGTNAAPTTSMAGGRCTRCGGELVQRTDDSGEIVRTRLAVYRGQTQPLVEYYRRRPTFRIVNGAQAPQQVASDFAAAIADAASGAGPGGRSPARAEVGSHP